MSLLIKKKSSKKCKSELQNFQISTISKILSGMKEDQQKSIQNTINSSLSVVIEEHSSKVWYMICLGKISQLFEISLNYKTLQKVGGIEKFSLMSKQDVRSLSDLKTL